MKSVDGIAFIIGIVSVAFHYLWPPVLGVTAAAVFLPAVLREIGWLKDADEFSLGVMRRAGFHALLAAVGLFFLNMLMHQTGAYTPLPGMAGGEAYAGAFVRKIVVGVFLGSSLLQYWGARRGTFWLLVGAAAVTGAQYAGMMLIGMDTEFLVHSVIGVGLMVGLLLVGAATVRMRPRLGSGLLLGLFVVSVAMVVWLMQEPRAIVGGVGVLVQTGLLFGLTGGVLWRREAG